MSLRSGKLRGKRSDSQPKTTSYSDSDCDDHDPHNVTMSLLTPPKHGSASRSLPTLPSGTGDATADTSSVSQVHESISKFYKYVQNALDGLIAGMKKLEDEISASIEFESKRITELEKKVGPLQTENDALKKTVSMLQEQINIHNSLINKQERFSRRNNLRIVGVPATENEDCIAYTESLLKEKFKMADVNIERAHRDGRGVEGKSPHILVKFLSYKDKIQILKSSRDVLKHSSIFITDDLTKHDLNEKRKWTVQVKELYHQNIKLSFYAGKWRRNGQPYDF